MSRPTLSVLMPFRNAATTVGETLVSILGQDFRDFELLAVDDGSDDDSASLIERHIGRDARVRVIPCQGHGIVDALNTGLAAATADIVVRMDADDLMLPGRLGCHVRHFRDRPSLILSATRVESHPPGALSDGMREYLEWQNAVLSPEDIADEIYVEAPFAHPTVAFRRDPVLALGGYRNGDFPEDYDLWLRLFHAGARMEKIPRALVAWRDHSERLTRTDARYARATFDALRAFYLARDDRLRRHGRPLWIWGAGRRTRRRADHLLIYAIAPAAWIDVDPRKIGNRIDGAPVHAPEALAEEPRPFVLVYVANHGARALIRTHLADYGYLRGQDYLIVG